MAKSEKKATEKKPPTSKARSFTCIRCGARVLSDTGCCRCGYKNSPVKK